MVLRWVAIIVDSVFLAVIFLLLTAGPRPQDIEGYLILGGVALVLLINIMALFGSNEAASWFALRMRRKAVEEKARIKQLEKENWDD